MRVKKSRRVRREKRRGMEACGGGHTGAGEGDSTLRGEACLERWVEDADGEVMLVVEVMSVSTTRDVGRRIFDARRTKERKDWGGEGATEDGHGFCRLFCVSGQSSLLLPVPYTRCAPDNRRNRRPVIVAPFPTCHTIASVYSSYCRFRYTAPLSHAPPNPSQTSTSAAPRRPFTALS